MKTRLPLAAVGIAAASAVAFIPQQAVATNSCGVPFSNTTYLVSTPTHLRGLALLGCNTSYDVRLLADIDLTGTGEFPPFGTNGNRFSGTFDGNGHTIRGLEISAPAADGFGLLGYTSGATIRDLTVSGTVAGGAHEMGGLVVGAATNTTITNVRATGTVSGHSGIGGLAGSLENSTVTDASVTADVTAAETAGGLAAWMSSDGTLPASLTRVRTEGSVTGTVALAGGLIGGFVAGAISGSSSSSSVRGAAAGGLIGQGQAQGNGTGAGASVSDSYATGAIAAATTSASVGGIAGKTCSNLPTVFTRNYFTGTLTLQEGSTSGGIVGGSNMCVGSIGPPDTSTGNLWNSDTAGPAGAGGTVGVGKTTAQMKELGTYTELGWSIVNGWDAAGTSTWGICPQVNNGYPFLQSTGARTACKAPAQAPTAAALTTTLLPSRRRVVSGQALRMGIRVANTGGTAAQSVSSCVRLPVNLVIVRASGARRSGRTACFAVGTVAGGAKATRTITVRAVSLRRRTVTVTGSATATGIPRTAAAAPVRVTVTPRRARARVTG